MYLLGWTVVGGLHYVGMTTDLGGPDRDAPQSRHAKPSTSPAISALLGSGGAGRRLSPPRDDSARHGSPHGPHLAAAGHLDADRLLAAEDDQRRPHDAPQPERDDEHEELRPVVDGPALDHQRP